MTIKIQPQSGLGDLLFALPLIEKLVSDGQAVLVATNHGYALAPYGDAVQGVPVEFEHRLPVIQHDAHHLKYNRYGAHYFKSYFEAFFSADDLLHWVGVARERFKKYAANSKATPFDKYYVFAPSRAANRHKHLPQPFECAPMRETVWAALERARVAGAGDCVAVGQAEKYADPTEKKFVELDLSDNLSFFDLVNLVANAERVVSQVSAITALAGLLGVPTDFLQARTETAVQHARHVEGIVWPGQVVI